MKLILERFKNFLQEVNLSQLALFHAKDSDVHTLVFYNMSSDISNPSVVAAIEIAKTQQSCIPVTYQVEWVFTKEEYRGKGLGETLYGISFYLTNSAKAGLTSDQNTGTSTAAGRRWAKLVKDKKTVARKTPGIPPKGGHSEFDYGKIGSKKTPDDPLDDCGLDGKAPGGDGINQSLMLKNYNKYADDYKNGRKNHEEFMKKIPKNERKEFENDLEQIAFEEFSIAYDGD